MPTEPMTDSPTTAAVRNTLRRVLASGLIADCDRDAFFTLALKLVGASQGIEVPDAPPDPAISPRRRKRQERRVKALIACSHFETRPMIPHGANETRAEARLRAAREIVARIDLAAAAGLIPRGWGYHSWNMRQTAQHSIAPLMGKIRRQRGDW